MNTNQSILPVHLHFPSLHNVQMNRITLVCLLLAIEAVHTTGKGWNSLQLKEKIVINQ